MLAGCAQAAAAKPEGIPDEITISSERIAPDSARLIAKWLPACDNKGCADAYLVKWTNDGRTVRSASVPGTADSVRMGLPAYGDSTPVTFAITTQRRGRAGPTKTVGVILKNVDANPPGVDSVKVDTGHVAFADSARLEIYSSRGAFLEGNAILVQEGDSLLAVNHHFMKPGGVRPDADSSRWTIENQTAVMQLRNPFGSFHDSVWIFAASCGCKESGDSTNPPMLDPANGKYRVRSASGGWRPVTPLAVDPFAVVGAR